MLAERGLSRRALADGLGIRHTTLRASFLPRGRAPSKANIARIRAWLEATEQEKAAAKADNGNAATPWAAYRLTDAQRERLAGYAELDERVVRKTVGVAPDIISAAVAGESLAPELISRLVGFLE